MVLRHYLGYSSLLLHEKNEILCEVEKSLWVTGAKEDGFEGDDTLLALRVYFLPVVEMAPFGGDGPHLGLASVGQNDEGVEPE